MCYKLLHHIIFGRSPAALGRKDQDGHTPGTKTILYRMPGREVGGLETPTPVLVGARLDDALPGTGGRRRPSGDRPPGHGRNRFPACRGVGGRRGVPRRRFPRARPLPSPFSLPPASLRRMEREEALYSFFRW